MGRVGEPEQRHGEAADALGLEGDVDLGAEARAALQVAERVAVSREVHGEEHRGVAARRDQASALVAHRHRLGAEELLQVVHDNPAEVFGAVLLFGGLKHLVEGEGLVGPEAAAEQHVHKVLDVVLDTVAVSAVGQVQLAKRDQPAVVLVVLREPLLEWADEEATPPLEQEHLGRRRLDDHANMVKPCAKHTAPTR